MWRTHSLDNVKIVGTRIRQHTKKGSGSLAIQLSNAHQRALRPSLELRGIKAQLAFEVRDVPKVPQLYYQMFGAFLRRARNQESSLFLPVLNLSPQS